MIKNKEVFTITREDGGKVELAVVRPSVGAQDNGQKAYNIAFRKAIDSKALTRMEVDAYLRTNRLWTDEMDKEMQELQDKIAENADILENKGGVRLSEAKSLAIEIAQMRGRIREILYDRHQLDQQTAEAQAENAKFNRLVYECLVYNDGKNTRYYASYEDYEQKSGEEAAYTAASKLSDMLYNLDPDYKQNLPENKFLTKYKFMDAEGRLLDKEGNFVDLDGRRVDKDGRFINEDGEFVNRQGERVDEDGKVLVKFEPFLDDDGNPLSIEEEEVEVVST